MHSIAVGDASVSNVQEGFTSNNCDVLANHLQRQNNIDTGSAAAGTKYLLLDCSKMLLVTDQIGTLLMVSLKSDMNYFTKSVSTLVNERNPIYYLFSLPLC